MVPPIWDVPQCHITVTASVIAQNGLIRNQGFLYKNCTKYVLETNDIFKICSTLNVAGENISICISSNILHFGRFLKQAPWQTYNSHWIQCAFPSRGLYPWTQFCEIVFLTIVSSADIDLVTMPSSSRRVPTYYLLTCRELSGVSKHTEYMKSKCEKLALTTVEVIEISFNVCLLLDFIIQIQKIHEIILNSILKLKVVSPDGELYLEVRTPTRNCNIVIWIFKYYYRSLKTLDPLTIFLPKIQRLQNLISIALRGNAKRNHC